MHKNPKKTTEYKEKEKENHVLTISGDTIMFCQTSSIRHSSHLNDVTNKYNISLRRDITIASTHHKCQTT